jgi:hypothetical protein
VTESQDARWARYLAALTAYLAEHGHEPPTSGPGRVYRGMHLGTWLRRQRKRWRDGILAPERLHALRVAGIVLDPPHGGTPEARTVARDAAALARLGHTHWEIAARLGVPVITMRQVLRKAGVDITPTGTTVRRLLAGGASDRGIERDTGVPRRQVARVRRDLGIGAWSPTMPPHGTDARYQHGCPCDPCAEAHAVYNALEHAGSGRVTTRGPMPADLVADLDARRRESLTRTQATATRRGQRWTEVELATALDMTRTAEEAAVLLGRSRSAIEHQRAKHPADRTASGPLPRGRRATRPRA